MERIRLGITDDHALVRDGIISILSGVNEVEFISNYSSASETINGLLKQSLDVLFLDVNLPDISGIELSKKLHKEYPTMNIIMLSSHNEPSVVKSALKAGAIGYLSKNTTKAEMLEAISEVLQGKTYLSADIKSSLVADSLGVKVKHGQIEKLTRREQEVLESISEELTTQEIAEKLFISAKTVETHRMNLLQKFGVKNSVGLVKKAMEIGVI